eukprot:1161815-Pelagomonas_calceolata.AAC.15
MHHSNSLPCCRSQPFLANLCTPCLSLHFLAPMLLIPGLVFQSVCSPAHSLASSRKRKNDMQGALGCVMLPISAFAYLLTCSFPSFQLQAQK